MKSSITQLLKYQIVEDIHDDMLARDANTYISIGRPLRWGNDSNETADEVEDLEFNLNYTNQVFRDMVAIKKVAPSDIALVVPRVDWVTSTQYDPYADHISQFSHARYFTIGAANTTAGDSTVDMVNNSILTGNLSVGNVIVVGTETKEVIDLNVSTGMITVNSDFSTTYTQNNVIRLDNTYPQFANTFYVRNSKDQVFKCLATNGSVSTVEPTIDIDGQLPENPYIEPGDGYKWKYMYTIPYGMKQKFFTKKWMPVITDTAVASAAVDGRIDIISILDGGTGYYLDGGQSGNSNSLSIITVTGDGTEASVTAKVESGVITDLNIISGGKDYTTATVTVTDNDQLSTGTAASFDVVISPKGGHGFSPAKELGCYSVMVSTELYGTESGTIPVGTATGAFDFRQIALVRDPKLANGIFANGSSYSMTTTLSLSSPGITNYVNDETITDNVDGSTFSAVVVSWNPSSLELEINNITGTPTVGSQILGSASGAVSTLLDTATSDIKLFTGDLLYIENRLKVIRDVDQSEQIRLILSF